MTRSHGIRIAPGAPCRDQAGAAQISQAGTPQSRLALSAAPPRKISPSFSETAARETVAGYGSGAGAPAKPEISWPRGEGCVRGAQTGGGQ